MGQLDVLFEEIEAAARSREQGAQRRIRGLIWTGVTLLASALFGHSMLEEGATAMQTSVWSGLTAAGLLLGGWQATSGHLDVLEADRRIMEAEESLRSISPGPGLSLRWGL